VLGALPKPQVPDGPIRTLFEELHRLHHEAGWPSLRDIAREVGCSHTTISAAFSEPRVPRWGLLELIVEALGGDSDRFHELWLAASVSQQNSRTAAGSDQPNVPDHPRPVPRQLPADVVGFTGRATELAALDRLLERTSTTAAALVISTVSGTAGVGKTALAVHWAHRVADRFPDGQLYINLRGYDPDKPVQPAEALEGLLRELGVDGSAIPRELSDRAARFRTLVAGRRMLLLLDNAHSVGQVRDLLPGSGSCLVLVTSRDSLPALVARHGASRLTLDLLPPGEAVALLRRLIGARVDAEPGPAASLARQCACLPLALRVGAELAAALPRSTLADLVCELGHAAHRFDLLDAGEDEYTAVRAVFSWSYRHLSPDAARTFELLGLHPGRDIDTHAAAALTSTDLAGAHRLLNALSRAHLIDENDRGRFSMHDLLRAYVEEQVAEYPEPQRRAALAQLFDYYLHTATAAAHAALATHTAFQRSKPNRAALGGASTPVPVFAGPAEARAWLDIERPNLIAVAAAAAGSSPSHTTNLAATLARYLDAGAHYSDAATLGTLALQAGRNNHDRGAQASALLLLGSAYRRLGRYPEALEQHEQALGIYRELDDRAGIATALRGIGGLQWRLGRYLEALDQLNEAVRVHREVGDLTGEAGALNNLGIVCRRLGRYPEALDHYERALTVHRELGDASGQAGTMNNLGIVYLRLGRYREALDLYRQALAIYQQRGDRSGEAIGLNNLGEAYERLQRYDEAVRHHQAALTIYREVGYRIGEGVALQGLGAVYGRLGQYPEALDYLRQAIAIGDELGEVDLRTRGLTDLAEILRARGRHDDAAANYHSALLLAEKTANRYEQARAHDGLAYLEHRAGNAAEAHRHWQEALTQYTDLGVPEAGEVRDRLAALDRRTTPAAEPGSVIH
jgi:tetratricopeptide (TPR) repeat protein